MVIQRIQSVYLLIAVILMVIFAFFPALSFELADKTVLYGALETGRAGSMHIDPLLFTLIILISLLALIDIFLYKNLQRQMTVCFVDIIIGLAMLVAIGIQAFAAGIVHHLPDDGSQGHVPRQEETSRRRPLALIIAVIP